MSETVAMTSVSGSPAAGGRNSAPPRPSGGGQGSGLPAVAQDVSKVPAEVGLAIAVVATLGVMVLPLPPFLLDMLLALSVSLSLVVFLVSLNVEKPLQFSSFPSLLLLVTLLRLALNIASTRLILLRGHEGTSAAGHVIQAFGEFVVGGNVVVGIVVFLILVVINFVVITKGAGRIAEVAARFTLDAMPGKQMAIDADLAAGQINEHEARQRRRAVEQEADFFGAMDGASKFVRGDAVAGLVITGVNIVGGLIIGVLQRNMQLGNAASTYTQLTVGDGLVSQIPALLTSVAAGLITTRAATGGSLGGSVKTQMFGAQRPIALAAGLLFVLALVPGMPHVPFFALALVMGAVSRRASKESVVDVVQQNSASAPRNERAELEASLPVDLLEIEVGYELVSLIEGPSESTLLGRISSVRKQLAQELGVIVPPIHLRDNLRLRAPEYRILLSNCEIGRGEVRHGRLLAMSSTPGAISFPGEAVVEPAFGLSAVWISQNERDRAELNGLTVVDAPTVIATHLGELLTHHASELLGRKELQELLDLHGKECGKVIEELVPTQLTAAQLLRVLRNLLRERVAIRDLRTILETLADHVGESKDPDVLTEYVRQGLSRAIAGKHRNPVGEIRVMTLAPTVENIFRRLQSPGGQVAPSPDELQNLLHLFESASKNFKYDDELPALLVATDIRRAVASFALRHLPGLQVLGFRELDSKTTVRTIGVLGESVTAKKGVA